MTPELEEPPVWQVLIFWLVFLTGLGLIVELFGRMM